jgi:hypothetical protein
MFKILRSVPTVMTRASREIGLQTAYILQKYLKCVRLYLYALRCADFR